MDYVPKTFELHYLLIQFPNSELIFQKQNKTKLNRSPNIFYLSNNIWLEIVGQFEYFILFILYRKQLKKKEEQ